MEWGSLLSVLLGGVLAAGGGYLAQSKSHRDAVKRIRVENLAQEANTVAEGISGWNLLKLAESVMATGATPLSWTGGHHGLSGDLNRLGFWLDKPDHVSAQVIFVTGDLAWLPEAVSGTQFARDRVAQNVLGYHLILAQLVADTKSALSRLAFDGEDAFIRDVEKARNRFKVDLKTFFHRSDL